MDHQTHGSVRSSREGDEKEVTGAAVMRSGNNNNNNNKKDIKKGARESEKEIGVRRSAAAIASAAASWPGHTAKGMGDGAQADGWLGRQAGETHEASAARDDGRRRALPSLLTWRLP